MKIKVLHASTIIVCISVLLMFCSCSRTADRTQERDVSTINKKVFGTLPDGRVADLYSIKNQNGFEIKVTNYGGIITSILATDKKGKHADVVVGFDDLDSYLRPHPHVGPLIGRYSGYIANGSFTIDGVAFKVAKNSGPNHLHGGVKAFDKVLWNASEVQEADGRGVRLTYRSPDGEEGYPGNVDVSVTYIVRDDNSLHIEYQATTDRKTHVNLTNHLYFNLSGAESRDISNHQLRIAATHYAVPGAGNIPTGELRNVQGSPLDFSNPRAIGGRIGEMDNGYDHNYVLKEKDDGELIHAASVWEPGTGRIMDVFTTHTGLEFASADWLEVKGRSGRNYGPRSAFLLYPQHLPDSPNRPEFPPTLLEPGDVYHQKTVYKFSTW